MVPPPPDLERRPAARAVRRAGEVVLGLLAFGTAWPFGAVEPFWEAIATAGVALLCSLWAIHTGLTRRLRLRFDAPALLLCGLIALSGLQLVPLPAGVVGIVSPSTARWHTEMRPATAERLPGESTALERPTSFPISLDPTATRLFACRLFALLAVYLAARNWLATRDSLRRLAWLALVTGTALAVVALGQYFSSPPTTIYWSVPTAGAVFGPFVCRNHYPDFLALCIGLGAGIPAANRKSPTLGAMADLPPGTFWEEAFDLLTAPLQLLHRPAAVAAALGVGLMLASISFSLSRGAMLALLTAALGTFFLARRRPSGTKTGTRTAVTLAAAASFAAVAWLGWQPLGDRLGDIGSGRSPDDRTALWKTTLPQVPGFWLGGAGNGTHLRIELLGRSETEAQPIANSVSEHAHNEYLEAAVEGGMPRFAITLAMPAFVLLALARGYRKLHDRSAGPPILGVWFGVAMIAAHAVTDFALHIPAVALLAVTATAFALAAANDSEFHTAKRRRSSGTSVEAPARSERTHWMGWPAVALAASLALVMLLLTSDARQRHLGDKYLRAGMESGRSTRPEANRHRIDLLEASIAADPRNPDAFFQLAQAHLDAANDLSPIPAEALAGPVLPRRARPERHPPEMIEAHILPALRALRTARDLCPLVAEVHARLGLLAGYCAESEPALVHLERAKRILKNDPDIWYACGVEAARTGDRAGAIAQWKQSLRLSPKQLRPILRAARSTLTPEEMLDALLPDDPVVLLAAADDLHPDRRTGRARRAPFLMRAADGERPNATVEQWIAVAKARGELERIPDARGAWERAIALDGDRAEAHDGLARLLEVEELYAEALPQLEWLASRRPADGDLKLRLVAARHGAKLNRQIGP